MSMSTLLFVLLIFCSAIKSRNAFQVPKQNTRQYRVPVPQLLTKQQQQTQKQQPQWYLNDGVLFRRSMTVASDSDKCPVTRLSRQIQNFWKAVWHAFTFPMRWMIRVRSKTYTQPKSVESPTLPIDTISESKVMEEQTTTINDILPKVKKPTEDSEITTTIAADIPTKSSNTSTSSSKPTVDLSGDWTIIVSDAFKAEYDEYLKQLGQPMLVRSIALGIIGRTTEQTIQRQNGNELFIRGTNARGVWERSLWTNNHDNATTFLITTADAEQVQASAWWEENGTVHKSWLRGVTKYGGGDFESKRYLQDNGKVLVTESSFHPADPTRATAKVTWRFLKNDIGQQ